MKFPCVYLIVDSTDWLRRLLPVGVQLVQLRIKGQQLEYIRREIRESKSLCERFGVQLVVNDYLQLAMDEGCDFVHLGQGDLDSADIPVLRRRGIRIGISTHDHAELDRAISQSPAYVALGPIYPTLLKVMPWSPQGLQRITEWKTRLRSMPLVAIGGLTPERLPSVFSHGADTAAVVTDIVRNPNPETRLREWLSVATTACCA